MTGVFFIEITAQRFIYVIVHLKVAHRYAIFLCSLDSDDKDNDTDSKEESKGP